MLPVLCYSPVLAAVRVTLPSRVTTQISCTQLLHRHVVTSRRWRDVNNAERSSDFTWRLPGMRQKFGVLPQFVEVWFPLYFNTCLCFSWNDRIKSDGNIDAMIVTQLYGGVTGLLAHQGWSRKFHHLLLCYKWLQFLVMSRVTLYPT
jgi:hypothetical protein